MKIYHKSNYFNSITLAYCLTQFFFAYLVIMTFSDRNATDSEVDRIVLLGRALSSLGLAFSISFALYLVLNGLASTSRRRIAILYFLIITPSLYVGQLGIVKMVTQMTSPDVRLHALHTGTVRTALLNEVDHPDLEDRIGLIMLPLTTPHQDTHYTNELVSTIIHQQVDIRGDDIYQQYVALRNARNAFIDAHQEIHQQVTAQVNELYSYAVNAYRRQFADRIVDRQSLVGRVFYDQLEKQVREFARVQLPSAPWLISDRETFDHYLFNQANQRYFPSLAARARIPLSVLHEGYSLQVPPGELHRTELYQTLFQEPIQAQLPFLLELDDPWEIDQQAFVERMREGLVTQHVNAYAERQSAIQRNYDSDKQLNPTGSKFVEAIWMPLISIAIALVSIIILLVNLAVASIIRIRNLRD